MNIAQINALRSKLNLPAIAPAKPKSNNQAKNQAVRAQANRDMKAKRASNKK